jgi:hypothetical protein
MASAAERQPRLFLNGTWDGGMWSGWRAKSLAGTINGQGGIWGLGAVMAQGVGPGLAGSRPPGADGNPRPEGAAGAGPIE